MLGHIITVVSGKPYQQYITDNILKPLGMNDTEWEYDRVPAQKLALGYRWLDNQWVEEPLLHDGSYGAMGGLITSIEDFSKYVALHEAAWPPRSDANNGRSDGPSIKRSSNPRNDAALDVFRLVSAGKKLSRTIVRSGQRVWVWLRLE